MLESLFNIVAGLKVCYSIKKRLQHRCFLGNLQILHLFYRTVLVVKIGATVSNKYHVELQESIYCSEKSEGATIGNLLKKPATLLEKGSSIAKFIRTPEAATREVLYPLKKCWNFKAVFQSNSAGIPEIIIWNHSGILMKFHWNTDFVQIYRMFSRIIPMKYHSFFAERTGILMEFLWYFDGMFVVFCRIWVVFWWNFSSILMEFQSKK